MTKEFLEEYPLFKKLEIDKFNYLAEIKAPPLNMVCDKCEEIQTFKIAHKIWQPDHSEYKTPFNLILRLNYNCSACGCFSRQFYIYFNDEGTTIHKVGQYPAWEVKMDKELKKALGKHSSLYQKGLVCESQGYGIAAFSYYRRITEDIIDELLDSIKELVDDANINKYSEALSKVKATRVTQEKINLIKDLLPPILKPNGNNPLGILHSELSAGLHSESDEVCLEIAGHIKNILVFLINQVIQAKNASKLFTDSMKSILEKKSKK